MEENIITTVEENEETNEVSERTRLTNGQSFVLGGIVTLLAMAAGHKAREIYDNHKIKKAAKKAKKVNETETADEETSDEA